LLVAPTGQAQEAAMSLGGSVQVAAPPVAEDASFTTAVAPANASPVESSLVEFSPVDPLAFDRSQVAVSQNQEPPRTATNPDGNSLPNAPTPQSSPSTPPNKPDEQFGKQPKRILGIVPNYRAVSANQHLPPLNFKGELWLATQDSFDYSSFIFVGALAGIDMAQKSQPAFGQGAEGFGKYYWHVFVDSGIENYMTEAIVPAATKEDPRYYTLGKGGFVKRTGYAVSRLFVTRTNSGTNTFNLSEIVGAGASAGIGNAYYPSESNPWVKTYQRWGTQVGLDGVFNALKEFWPDIDHAVFHGKY
jgi:hypothetical protein